MDFFTPILIAFTLLFELNSELYEIITLSLTVSLTAVASALLFVLPLGAVLASFNFPGRSAFILLFNTLLSIPPVVIGLIVYMLISRSGPLGFLDILYSPAAMMLAQFCLILPLSIALSRQLFEALHNEYDPLFSSMGLSWHKRILALITDGRSALITIGLACFGRAISEVGAVIIVGGNIRHFTRVMTSAIALETSKGELAFALALGCVLMFLALLVNLASHYLRLYFQRGGMHV